MPVTLNTVTEALEFLDSFDGFGMIATDESSQVAKLREHHDLIDDYTDEAAE